MKVKVGDEVEKGQALAVKRRGGGVFRKLMIIKLYI